MRTKLDFRPFTQQWEGGRCPICFVRLATVAEFFAELATWQKWSENQSTAIHSSTLNHGSLNICLPFVCLCYVPSTLSFCSSNLSIFLFIYFFFLWSDFGLSKPHSNPGFPSLFFAHLHSSNSMHCTMHN